MKSNQNIPVVAEALLKSPFLLTVAMRAKAQVLRKPLLAELEKLNACNLEYARIASPAPASLKPS